MAEAFAIVGAGIKLYEGISGYQAARKQERQMAKALDFNEKMSEMQSDQALAQGESDAARYQGEVKKVVGKQRSSYAAQGVDVDSGTAAAVQDETSNLAQVDVMTIKSNAWREAWGHRVEGLNASLQGAFQMSAVRNQGTASLLSGGLGALGYGAKFAKAAGFSKADREDA